MSEGSRRDRKGWFLIHRKIEDNPIWLAEKFTRGQAWVDLILLANHEADYFYVRNVKVNVARGQVGWSEPKLAARWKWSRTKVRNFLKMLETEQQIKIHKNNVTQIVTLVNYEKYQPKKTAGEQQKNSRRTAKEQQEDLNKQFNEFEELNELNETLPEDFPAGKKKDYAFIDRVIEAFCKAHGNYEILNRGKERAAAGKLLKLYKQKYPDADSEKTIEGLKTYFKLCVNIEDNWLRQRMALPLIVSKFNEINAVLNGKSKKSATDAGLDQLWNEIRGRMDGIS